MDYKSTLNLPQTAFPMKANLPQKEPERLAWWEQERMYARIQESRKDRPLYILHDGPPYANGHIHIGHGLNKILKDIIIKSKTMDGFRVPYIPGWDCHGLPIEHQVSKQLGSKKKDLTPVELRKILPGIRPEICGDSTGRISAIRNFRGLGASLSNHGFCL